MTSFDVKKLTEGKGDDVGGWMTGETKESSFIPS